MTFNLSVFHGRGIDLETKFAVHPNGEAVVERGCKRFRGWGILERLFFYIRGVPWFMWFLFFIHIVNMS